MDVFGYQDKESVNENENKKENKYPVACPPVAAEPIM